MTDRDPPLQFLSLGAGVQSSTLALMAAAGEFDVMPEAAIFSDTQAEPKEVYDWLDYLEPLLPFPVHRVTAGSLAEEALRVRRSKRTGRYYVRTLVPAFLDMGEDEKASMLWRRCTRDFKIRPIQTKLRELVDLPRRWAGTGVWAVSWIGISTDEITRMKPSRDEWNENRWPLIEKEMSRSDCLAWMKAQGHPTPPRSACTFCPYHSNAEWKRLKETDPEGFEAAAKWEDALQAVARVDERYIGVPYVWSGLKPLREANFSGDVAGQQFLWDDECEGMCGV